MTNIAQASLSGTDENDPVSNFLKWVLLIVAFVCFLMLIWGTYKTYQSAPPIPANIISSSNKILMTEADIVAGKAGFQRADLMDYGSIYGMGSYFGEDYTAKYLVRLGQMLETEMAQQRFSQPLENLSVGNRYEIRLAMQNELKNIDLTQQNLKLSPELSKAIELLQIEITNDLLNHNFQTGWTKAYSLNSKSALETANFLLYSSLTTVANRPGQNFSYTNNWPYQPEVGNIPTTSTFYWTWISFCFVFAGFGVVLYIYHRYLSEPDAGVKTPFLLTFQPLTASQRKVGKYFMIVSLVPHHYP